MPNRFFGAGEGNRTLVSSLENSRSTIELHPHVIFTLLSLHNDAILGTHDTIPAHSSFTPQGKLWSGCADSNCGPPRPKRGALPTVLHPDNTIIHS